MSISGESTSCEDIITSTKIESFEDFLIFIKEAKMSKTKLGKKISKSWSQEKEDLFRSNIKYLLKVENTKKEEILLKQEEMMISVHKISMGKLKIFISRDKNKKVHSEKKLVHNF